MRLFKDLPFCNPSRQDFGLVMEKLIREEYEFNVGPTSNPTGTKFKNGQHAYDFFCNNSASKVEVKCARPYLMVRKGKAWGWVLRFKAIKTKESEKVLLVSYFPDGVIVKEWDGVYGKVGGGKTEHFLGHDVFSRRKHTSWESLKCEPFGKVLFIIDNANMKRKERLNSVRTEKSKLYEGTPFMSLSRASKGLLCQELAKMIYNDLVCEATESKNVSYDFQNRITGARIEVKTASMDVLGKDKKFTFYNIKEGCFDELILVFQFPDRLEFWLWNGCGNLYTIGHAVNALGKRMVFFCGLDLTPRLSPGELLSTLPF